MKKLFNLRPLFFGALSLIFSVLTTANYFLDKTIVNLVLLILFYVVVSCICGLGVSLVIKKKFNNLKFITICLVVAVSLIGLIGTSMFLVPQTQIVGPQNITATIEDVKVYDNSVKLNLKDVSANEHNLKGYTELVVFNYGTEINLSVGDTINAVANYSTISKKYNNLSYVINNINYSATCSLNDFEVIEPGSNLKSLITLNVKENLNTYLNSDNAKIAYSILFGEKENMSDIYSIFSSAGIAHILAVSGLHIGFLVAMIVCFFKLIKCNKHVINVIVFVLLMFYCYLCGFTPSIVRAMIMSMVLLISKSYGKQYDALSSLSLAAIIILMFSPMSIFSVGFQLSFGCVFAIVSLTRPINNLLSKMKCPNFLLRPISISVAVNLGIMAITAAHFNEINFISTISNLIVLPVFSVCFGILFITSFIGLIVPVINYVLVVPNFILHFIKLIANFFADVNFLNFKVFTFDYLLIVISFILIYFIGFAITNNKTKNVVSAMVLVCVLFVAVISNLPTVFNSVNGYTSYVYSGNYVFLTEDNNNKILVLNSVDGSSKIQDKLTELKVNKIDCLVVNNYSIKYDDIIKDFVESYNIKTLFIEDDLKDVAYKTLSKIVYVKAFNENVKVGEVEINVKYFNDKNIGLQFNINNNLVLMLNDDVSKKEIKNLSFENVSYDYVVYNNLGFNLSETELLFDNLVSVKNA